LKKSELIEILLKEKNTNFVKKIDMNLWSLRCGRNRFGIRYLASENLDFNFRHFLFVKKCKIIYSTTYSGDSKHFSYMDTDFRTNIFQILDHIQKDGFNTQTKLPKIRVNGLLTHPTLYFDNPQILEFVFLSPEKKVYLIF
jgi:hypothetical protein